MLVRIRQLGRDRRMREPVTSIGLLRIAPSMDRPEVHIILQLPYCVCRHTGSLAKSLVYCEILTNL